MGQNEAPDPRVVSTHAGNRAETAGEAAERVFGVGDLCAYCGEVAQCLDHVIPRACFAGTRGKDNGRGFTVPSCLQCNCWLSDQIFVNLAARKSAVHNWLKHKYKRTATGVIWDEDELSELRGKLLKYMDIMDAKRRVARERIEYSGCPPHHRWTDMEKRWLKKQREADDER